MRASLLIGEQRRIPNPKNLLASKGGQIFLLKEVLKEPVPLLFVSVVFSRSNQKCIHLFEWKSLQGP